MPAQIHQQRLFFVYGEHVHPQQMQACCPQAKVCAVARLPGYALGFVSYAKKWDGGEAAAIPRAGASLWGVVYELSADDEERLDCAHRVRLDGSGAYFHSPATVIDADGGRHEVLLYQRNVIGQAQTPTAEYIDCLVHGAQAQALPADHIASLRQTTSKKASFAVPRASIFRPIFSLEHGCSC